MSPDETPPAGFLRLEGVRKSYADLTVLDGIDLDVARGERVALIGASGSGKSTILRLLMTLERPDAGRVLVDGVDPWTVGEGTRQRPAPEEHVRAVRLRVARADLHPVRVHEPYAPIA